MKAMRNLVANLLTSLAQRKVDKESVTNNLFKDLSSLCRGKAQIVFDIGAHHGKYAQKINEVIAVDRFYCFEPYPPSFKQLRQSLDQNKFLTYPIALSNCKGSADFYTNHFDETNSLLPSTTTNSQIDSLIAPENIIQVEVDTLDSFCASHGIAQIDILKIDTQGNTYNVLNGGSDLLQRGSIKFVQCEVEFIEIYKDEQLYHRVAALMEKHSYQLYSIYNLHYDINNRLSWGDALFTRNVKRFD